METNNIQTRKDEIRFFTNKPEEMLGKYLAKRLLRTWQEDFVDNDTGEVVSIDRNEIIADRGQLITGDLLAVIRFHLQSGDISEVEVSNQKREGILSASTQMFPWMVTICIAGGKKKKFLLYASSIGMAIEIVCDYVELEFSGMFTLFSAKSLESCIILKDNLLSISECENIGEDSEQNESCEPVKKFYQIDTTVSIVDGSVTSPTFVVEAKDVDRAMVIINDFIAKRIREKADEEVEEFEVKLETAKILSCNYIIEREFSMAYSEEL